MPIITLEIPHTPPLDLLRSRLYLLTDRDREARTLLTALQAEDPDSVDVSVGLVSLSPQSDLTLEDVYRAADHALYLSKARKDVGRDNYIEMAVVPGSA